MNEHERGLAVRAERMLEQGVEHINWARGSLVRENTAPDPSLATAHLASAVESIAVAHQMLVELAAEQGKPAMTLTALIPQGAGEGSGAEREDPLERIGRTLEKMCEVMQELAHPDRVQRIVSEPPPPIAEGA